MHCSQTGDKGGYVALGGALHHAVLCGHVGGIAAQDHAHGGDQRGDDGAVGTIRIRCQANSSSSVMQLSSVDFKLDKKKTH